jgi:hypothetical protein
MKLPNFYEFEPLNSVKKKMGIPQDVYGSLTVSVPNRLTELELIKLTSSEGLEISIDDVSFLPDETLAYKDSRIILYIRDVNVFGNQEVELPKFHLANCQTLQDMREKKRFGRYQVSANIDGLFNINLIKSGTLKEKKNEKLSVCQNCLSLLKFDGFQKNWHQKQRDNFVGSFRMDRFFEIYPRSLHSQIPKHNSDNAPLNIYSDDWDEISQKIRSNYGWCCQKCNIDLSMKTDRKWLHVHHINGLKNDNNRGNLKVLCIKCHAEEPSHAHIRNMPDYVYFLSEKHRIQST